MFAFEGKHTPDCLSAVQYLKPSALIGTSGQHGVFTKEVLEAMATANARPIIFAMSNPTASAECTAEEAYTHTQGRCVFASGSPFSPVTYRDKVFVSGQSNNVYIFPGLGLGIVACRIKRVTDEMFFAAAKTLASMVCDEDLACGRVYPSFKKIREVSLAIAEATASVAYEQKLAGKSKPKHLKVYLKSQMYEPVYHMYV
jgi:malate dehydrogenase (oxaloacetate-decarboxylating)(NADP+)